MSEEGSCKSKAPPPDLPDRNDRWEVIRWAVKSMEHQRSAVREKVRAAVKAAGIPLPTEVVTKLAQLSHQDVREVLVDHPGFKAWERLGSYRISLRVFERAVPDLLKAIEIFGAAVEDDILSRRKQDELDDIESAIQKELFAVTNAAHSLVDHSESIQELVDIPGYKAKRTEFFGNDGMHEFVRGFRNVLHHRHMIKAGWYIEHHFEKGTRASFTVSRNEVRFFIEQSAHRRSKAEHARILAYLSASPEVIDLKQVFEEYRRRVADFHAWYGEALASDSLIGLRDCERCLRESKNFGERTFWKAMLGNWLNWKEPPNPYDHLPRYLTPEEIAEVYRLPMQSEEQVDKVIEFLDTDHACDADLRNMAYRLFRRATPPALPHVT